LAPTQTSPRQSSLAAQQTALPAPQRTSEAHAGAQAPDTHSSPTAQHWPSPQMRPEVQPEMKPPTPAPPVLVPDPAPPIPELLDIPPAPVGWPDVVPAVDVGSDEQPRINDSDVRTRKGERRG
jgi:hypothetical protein